MKRSFYFHKRKFLTLASRQQHKKCAELLQKAYTVKENERYLLLHTYEKLLVWMNVSLPSLQTLKEIADRFHIHCREANIFLKEHSLLPQVQRGDAKDVFDLLPISIYLEGLRSIHNVGSIVRTTEAMRLGTLFFSKSMGSMRKESLHKSAMGTEEWIEWKVIDDPYTLPKPLIAVETVPTSIPYFDYPFPDTFTLAFGNEECGLSDNILAYAESIIHIPLYGKKNSINVANAFSIVASEISYQKRERYKKNPL